MWNSLPVHGSVETRLLQQDQTLKFVVRNGTCISSSKSWRYTYLVEHCTAVEFAPQDRRLRLTGISRWGCCTASNQRRRPSRLYRNVLNTNSCLVETLITYTLVLSLILRLGLRSNFILLLSDSLAIELRYG